MYGQCTDCECIQNKNLRNYKQSIASLGRQVTNSKVQIQVPSHTTLDNMQIFFCNNSISLLINNTLSFAQLCPFFTRREFLREILYKNIAIIAIQHAKFICLTALAIFSILLGEIHSSPSGKFPCTYQLKLPMWRVVITIQYGKNRHTVY